MSWGRPGPTTNSLSKATRSILIVLALTSAFSSAFHGIAPTPRKLHAVTLAAEARSRRKALKSLGFLSIVSSAAGRASADILRSPGTCASGEGDGCDSLAEENDFIKRLQKQSSEHREANEREALNAFYMKNYPDVFAVSDRVMVKKPDGSFALFTANEVKNLADEGKISREYPTSKGGRIADLTQKPVLVLREKNE